MNPDKQSKRALRSLISDSFKEALTTLDLPQPTKKVKKLIDRNAKKVASIYADVLKREEKKKKKAARLVEKALSNNSNGNNKKKRVKGEDKIVEPIKL